MSDNDMSALALQLFKEVQIEMGEAPVLHKGLIKPELEILSTFTGMPDDGLLLGIANDGLPLLLRLGDPRPGAVLITGERGSGVTEFLKVLVEASRILNLAQDARYVIITDTPSKFQDIDPFSHNLEVWPACQDDTVELLNEISWRIQFQEIHQPLVLMIDRCESILKMGQKAQDNLANILENGPQALVWPLVTINSEMALKLPQWLAYFRTRIYGRITNPNTVETLTPVPGAPLQNLIPGKEFCLRQKSNWLKFRLPCLAD